VWVDGKWRRLVNYCIWVCRFAVTIHIFSKIVIPKDLKYPELFKQCKMDNLSRKIILFWNSFWYFRDIVPLLQTTPENYKVCIFRLRDINPDAFLFNDAIKTFFVTTDVRLITPEQNGQMLTSGEIPVFDMKG
jgi:hypothetical protein